MGSDRRMAAARLIFTLSAVLAALVPVVHAGLADVLAVEIRPGVEAHRFDIDVTVRHADSGWDHFANRWEVLGPDGEIFAIRRLAHPHVHEQPFTRSLSGVRIPAGFTWIRVRAHDLVHGHGGREVTLSVPGR